MQKVLHETCLEYLRRRLSEGWKIVEWKGFGVILQSPEGLTKSLDIRNDVETLRPNEAGDYTNITSQFPPEGAHWDKVDEVVPDDATTYLYTPSDVQQKDAFGLQATAIPGGSTINSVKAYLRILAALAQPFLRLAAAETAGAKVGTETLSYGAAIYALTQDTDYVYAAGATQTVCKYLKATMELVDTSPGYGGNIYALAQDTLYIYAGGATTQTVRKYLKSTMALDDEGPGYGGTIYALTEDTLYIYAGGTTDQTVDKYLKSTMALDSSSPSYGGTIYALTEDTTHVYAGGATTKTVRQYLKSTMALDGESPGYGGNIRALTQDATHVYAAGYTTATVRKYLKSTMLLDGESPFYGGTIRALTQDATYVYPGGFTVYVVRKYLNSDLSQWLTFSEVLARPGGGGWAVADLNSLQVVIGLEALSTNAFSTQAYVEVDFTPPVAIPRYPAVNFQDPGIV